MLNKTITLRLPLVIYSPLVPSFPLRISKKIALRFFLDRYIFLTRFYFCVAD